MVKRKGKPFLLFHWSPVSRRKSILKYGLCPNKISKDNLWRPPYVCFSPSPSMAWCLTVMHCGSMDYDLWMMWSSVPKKLFPVFPGCHERRQEYRAFERIMKKDIWYVGTREYNKRKR
jgi:hypothetical protein